jgi:hypothetical protein
MTVHCPDCLTEVPPRKSSQDGRCDWCRLQVGGRRLRRAEDQEANR